MIIKTSNNIEFLIDDEDFDLISKYCWRAEFHCRSGKPYIIRIDKESTPQRKWVHREVLGLPSGRHIQIDHINGNPADNRKCNLRVCERGAQNAINRPKQKNNTSGYKGVFKRSLNCYRAAIRVNQKLLHLGQFTTPEEAALCYNKAAIKYFGEFAYLNEIKETL